MSYTPPHHLKQWSRPSRREVLVLVMTALITLLLIVAIALHALWII